MKQTATQHKLCNYINPAAPQMNPLEDLALLLDSRLEDAIGIAVSA